MKWTKGSIITILIVIATAMVSNYGAQEAAAYIFICFAIYVVYKTWSHRI